MAGLDFHLTRELPLPLSADGSPNVSVPLESSIFLLEDRPPGKNILTTGLLLYPSLEGGTPGGSATVTLVVWVRDETAQLWAYLPTRKVRNLQLVPFDDELRGGRIFVQVLAVTSTGAATKLVLHGMEM